MFKLQSMTFIKPMSYYFYTKKDHQERMELSDLSDQLANREYKDQRAKRDYQEQRAKMVINNFILDML